MLDDGNIRDRFLDSDLSEEDWLQPDDRVFEGVANEVFVQKEDRRRYWLWLFLGLGISMMVFAWLWCSSRRAHSIDQEHQLEIIEAKKSTKGDNEQVVNRSHLDHESEGKTVVDRFGTTKDLIRDKGASASGESNNVRKNMPQSASSEKSVLHHHKADVGRKSTNNLEEVISNPKPYRTSESIEGIKSFQAEPFSKEKDSERESWELMYLPVLGGLLSSNQTVVMEEAFEEYRDGQSMPMNTWNLLYGMGAGIWNLNLNNAYRNALDPADYKQDIGQSVHVYLGVEKTWGKRWSVRTNMTLGRARLISGHNSGFDYDVNEEMGDFKNTTTLDMASPLGFVSTPITIERENGMSQQNAYGLLLDLENRHQITNVDLSLDVSYAFIRNDRFASSISMGMGVQQIVSLENELVGVQIDHSSFKANYEESIAKQQFYQKRRSFLQVGFSTEKKLNAQHALELRYLYQHDLKDIYKQDDFSTRLNRHQISIGLKSSL